MTLIRYWTQAIADTIRWRHPPVRTDWWICDECQAAVPDRADDIRRHRDWHRANRHWIPDNTPAPPPLRIFAAPWPETETRKGHDKLHLVDGPTVQDLTDHWNNHHNPPTGETQE